MGDPQVPQQQPKKNSEALRILEALIFASHDVIGTDKLKSILPDQPDARAIRKMVNELNIQLQQERHPFEIVELAGGYQFRTVSYYQPWVQQLFKEKSSKKLSIQALECLAIIAYKQPITKNQIEFIRGVISDGAMKTLLEKRLITVAGRSDKPGRPLLYTTTGDFLKYFGINRVGDLPNIEEFEAIAKEKMEEFSEEELSQVEMDFNGTSQEGEAPKEDKEKSEEKDVVEKPSDSVQKPTEEQTQSDSSENKDEIETAQQESEETTKQEHTPAEDQPSELQ